MDESKNTPPSPIRMGEMKVDRDGNSLRMLVGSCVGLALYDRRQKVGGFAHIVLPNSRGKADHLGKFADTAIPSLIRRMQQLSDQQLKLTAKIAGGAKMFAMQSVANIGGQNVASCEQILRELRIPIVARHCGGEKGRRMTFDTDSGQLIVEVVGQPPVELN